MEPTECEGQSYSGAGTEEDLLVVHLWMWLEKGEVGPQLKLNKSPKLEIIDLFVSKPTFHFNFMLRYSVHI